MMTMLLLLAGAVGLLVVVGVVVGAIVLLATGRDDGEHRPEE